MVILYFSSSRRERRLYRLIGISFSIKSFGKEKYFCFDSKNEIIYGMYFSCSWVRFEVNISSTEQLYGKSILVINNPNHSNYFLGNLFQVR